MAYDLKWFLIDVLNDVLQSNLLGHQWIWYLKISHHERNLRYPTISANNQESTLLRATNINHNKTTQRKKFDQYISYPKHKGCLAWNSK